ncbi:hypothetical protein [Halobacteriovorax sp. ZH1_bin.1]|uniref:hypothetical protein n=1 Tax=Halobacteriovorax sp. ZH1_bin.1 TaxID=3157723 RepID=UPI0037181973
MKDKIETIILEALNEVLEDNGIDHKLNSEDMLFGDKGILDSMDLVNALVEIESRIADEFDKNISIVNEKAFSMKNSPFSNVNRLTEFVSELI